MIAPRTGHLEPAVLEALGALRSAYPDARISLVGASALAFHVSMTWRHTSDIDVVLTIALDDLASAEKKLIGWKRLDPPKWVAPNGVKVDIVPAPADALERRLLRWNDGWEMSLAGVAAALADRSHIVSHELDITVAPLAIIVVLKMAAYLDRPDRGKDLGDLAHILYEYPPDNDDRFFEDAIFDAGLTEEQARGTILAREVAAVVDAADRDVVNAFITKMQNESPDWSRFVSASPRKDDEERLRLHWDAFCTTFAAPPPAVVAAGPAALSDVMPLKFIVNGEEVAIGARTNEPLANAVEAALSQSRNTGRPPSEWELRRENGVAVDRSRTPRECELEPGAVLYLSLRAGAGGDAPRT